MKKEEKFSFQNNTTSQLYKINNNNSQNQDTNKPRKKCICEGRDKKVDADLYYKIKDENDKLKRTKIEQNERIKKLEVSLANIKESIIKERKLAEYKVINGKDYTNDLERTKFENQKLKFENDKKDIIIQGLQSNAIIKKTKKLSKNRKKCKSKDPLVYQNEKNDYLALIARLREQLKIANEDRRTLITELRTRQMKNNGSNQNGDMEFKLKNKNDINLSSTVVIDANNKELELIKNNLSIYMEKYEKERENNRQLQNDLAKLKGSEEQIIQYKILIKDMKDNEKRLEEELNDLRLSPFLKAGERGNIFRNYELSEKKLKEIQKELENKEKILLEKDIRLKELERENKQLKENFSSCEAERDKLKEESYKLKIAQQEREKNDKIFQDKLNKFVQYGQIDPNFAKMLTLLKYQNEDLDWSNLNVNYLEPNIDKSNEPIYLKEQIEKLKIEKSDLGKELELTKSLLTTQQEINDETKKLKDCDKKKYQAEVKYLKQKVEELLKLIDINDLPKEYIVQDPISGKIQLKDKTMLLNELIPPEEKDANLLDDNITEFSQDEDETEFTGNDNGLDIFFGECLYEDGLDDELGFSIDHMLSFFSVDFFIHETQTSDILNGKTPMFNFQLTFRVDVNENFINYLESEYIYIDIYSLRDNVQSIFGKGKIELKELIDIENSNKSSTRVINSICSIYYVKDKNLKVASLHYKMRMRKPLKESYKIIREQNQIIRIINPVHDVVMTKAEKNIKNYSYLGGKLYEIKILINKAVGLVVSSPGRKISPYFYYKFYKNGEKYSQISSGNDPVFEDVTTFQAQYNKELIDYLEKENLNIYIFDSMNPIEIDINNKDQIKLLNTNQEISKDLIGICRIQLKGLLLNDLIQGEFSIVNINNQKVGTLIVNIFWEELLIENNEELNLSYENELYKDSSIMRLANVLKSKGLSLDTAFNIFDIDKKNEISIDNFKITLISTLKFIQNQGEIEHLIKILYTNQSKTKLSKIDFFKIFSSLLSNDGPETSNQLMASSYNIEQKDNNYDTSPLPVNKIQSNTDSQFTLEAEKQNMNNTQKMNYNYFLTNSFGKTNSMTNNKENKVESSNAILNTNRTLEELGRLAFDYKLKMGDFSKLFQNLDAMGISKEEIRNAYQKMGIGLSDVELNKLWRKLSPDNKNIDYARFKEVHNKLFIPNNRKGIPIEKAQNLDNNLSSSQMTGNFMTQKEK